MFEEFEDEIIEWNKTALPDNTMGMQLEKIKEEIREMWDCINNNQLQEVAWEQADIVISVIGLKRFGFSIYDVFCHILFNFVIIDEEKIKLYIRQKLDILKTRKYEIINNVYRHVEE